MTPHVVDTVPAWKGIPAMILEPTSQEGQVWHDYFRDRKVQRQAARGRPVGIVRCCSPNHSMPADASETVGLEASTP